MSDRVVRTHCSARRDAGASLVELLMTVMITGIIGTALAATVTTLLRTTERVGTIVDESNGRLALLTAFERNAGTTSAAGVDVTQGAAGCTPSDPGLNLVQFDWNDGVLVRRAAYRLVTDGADTWIERRTCRGASAQYLVLDRVSVVANSLVEPSPSWAGNGPPAAVTIDDNVVRVVLTQTIGVTTVTASLQTTLGVMA
ncbi:MAG: hypothetical protein R2713_02920 [Ilumatobacteraceae bacterium]